jgi:hypothetical protein
MMRLPTLAQLRAQIFQHRCRARYCGAAGFQPFKLDEKAAARLRRQLLQIFTNPIALSHNTRFRSTYSDSQPMACKRRYTRYGRDGGRYS